MWSVSLFLSLTLAVCLPGQLFLANATEFPMAFGDVLPSLLALAVAGTTVVAVLLLAVPKGTVRQVGLATVFAIGCLAWVQSHLPWPYGIADGHVIDWTAHWSDALLDTTMWGAGILAAVWWRRGLTHGVAGASLILAAVQVSALSIQAAETPHRWIDDVTFDDSGRFTFSPDRNVIILVLDTFQTDLFQELLDDDPALIERFPGFTYFRNAISGYPTTAAAIPLILSGRYYDNTESFQRFVRTTYRTASLPQALTVAGFDVYYHNLYFWPSLYADETIATHVRSKGVLRYDPLARDRAMRLLAFGAFRYLPQPGKRLVEARIAGLVAPRQPAKSEPAAPALATLQPGPAPLSEPPLPGDGPFFQQMAHGAATTSARPAFKYFHLWGLHPPLTHDEALTPLNAPYTRDNALQQARGLLRLVDRFISTITKLQIYDRATIAILGDHGTAFDLRLVPVDPSSRTHPTARPVPTKRVFALPLMLFKRPGDRGPMLVSDAAVTLGDVPRTVMEALGLTSDFPGTSMFARDILPRRSRRVLFYSPGALRLSDDFFPPLREFNVSGFSWLEESWRQTGRVFRPTNAR